MTYTIDDDVPLPSDYPVLTKQRPGNLKAEPAAHLPLKGEVKPAPWQTPAPKREKFTGKLTEWIETHIQLPQGLAFEPGPIRLWAYQRGIADTLIDPAYERVSLLKPARVGFTSLLTAALAYYIAEEPCPILCVQPTDADARDYMVSDIEPIFDASPRLTGVLPLPNRSPGDRSRLTHRVMKDGSSLKIVSAKSPRNFRRHTARILLCDEIDAYFTSAEGDPLKLAERRTLSFGNRKIICGSTPLFAETSHATRLYEQSDRRIFECPCPRCGAYTEIMWEHIEWPENRPELAAYRCPHCRELIDESNKPWMVENGRWRATAPHVRNHAGFRLNALISNLPAASWGKLAQEFLGAKDYPDQLKTFVNTILGQPWRMTEGTAINEVELMEKAERFDLQHIPSQVIAISAGVDVQDDRLEVTIVGWSKTDPYVLAHEVIHGPYNSDQTWLELGDLLKERFPHPNGGLLAIDAACIDAASGSHMEYVLKFCTGRAHQRILAIKGQQGLHRPPIIRSTSRHMQGRKKMLWLVGVDTIKQTLFSLIERGQIHFSDTLDLSWFEQFISERRVTRYYRGKPTIMFERIAGRRAEALDATVYAFAARSVLTLDTTVREAELKDVVPPRRETPKVIRSAFFDRGRI